jgi:hypothetical protein
MAATEAGPFVRVDLASNSRRHRMSSLRMSGHTFANLLAEEAEAKEVLATLDPVQEAALYIQDALHFTTHTHPREGWLARKLHLVQLRIQPYRKMAQFALVLLCFFEIPAWCATMKGCPESLQNGGLTGNWSTGNPLFAASLLKNPVNSTEVPREDVVYPTFGLVMLPFWASTMIEMLLFLFLAVELACNVIAQGWRRFLSAKEGQAMQPVYALLFFFAVVDAIVRAFSPWPAGARTSRSSS